MAEPTPNEDRHDEAKGVQHCDYCGAEWKK